MTTRGRYLRLHVCIVSRRALVQRLSHGAAAERPGNFPWAYPQPSAVCIGLDTGNNEHQRKALAGVRFVPTNFNKHVR